MSGDYSRERFDPSRHFSGVRLQQGRVQLDADWNEEVAIRQRRQTAGTLDTVGRWGVPPQTPEGFRVGFAGSGLTIGPGRLYIDGHLAENHGRSPAFDPLLAETVGTQPLPFDEQPYRRSPAAALPAAGVHLAYLVVWQREVDALQAPDLVEPALGVDTTTRTQTAWQVRLHPVPGLTALPPECPAELPGWTALTAPSAGRLTVTTVPVDAAEAPCELPPSGGYRGLENQLYRVEIHDVDATGKARFKWSRDNATVATAVVDVPGARQLTVASLGRDDVLGFHPGEWIELVDDVGELGAPFAPGFMARLVEPVEGRTLTLDRDLPATLQSLAGRPDDIAASHLRVRRWDQSRGVDADGLLVVDAAAPATLEAGIRVQFGTVAGGQFHLGDYWLFAARTSGATVDRLTAAPPAGVHRHYCPLALVDFGQREVLDCRVRFPALGDVLGLFYLGGDGQELPIDPANPPATRTLPRPLRVGVARGRFPVRGARVTFEVIGGSGSVAPPSGTTGADGSAECRFTLDAATEIQTVQATLRDAAGTALHLPVQFSARLARQTTGGGCAVAVATGADGLDLLEVVLKRLADGTTDLCLCLSAGTYSVSRLALDAAELRERLGITAPVRLRIAGCGDTVRLVMKGPWLFRGLASVTLAELVLDAEFMPPPEGALRFEDCGAVTLTRCEVAGPARPALAERTDLEAARQGALVVLSRCQRAAVDRSVLEAASPGALKPLAEFFRLAGLDRLADLLATSTRPRFAARIDDTVAALLDRQAATKAFEQIARALHRDDAAGPVRLTIGTWTALAALAAALESDRPARSALAVALAELRRAALRAGAGLALLVEASPTRPRRLDEVFGTLREGDAAVRVDACEIAGWMSVYGYPRAFGLTLDQVAQFAKRVREGGVFAGDAGTLLLTDSRISGLTAGGEALAAAVKGATGTALDSLFGRFQVSGNVIDADANVLLAERTTVVGNQFTLAAVTAAKDATPAPDPSAILQARRLLALTVGDGAVLTGNQSRGPGIVFCATRRPPAEAANLDIAVP